MEEHEIDLPSLLSARGDAEAGIVEVDGCFLSRSVHDHLKQKDFPDRTGFECALNHEHLRAANRQEIREVLKWVAGLKSSMRNCHPGVEFRIIVSFADDEAVVRFHKLRPSEEWINLSNLDGYLEEAVAVITVGNQS